MNPSGEATRAAYAALVRGASAGDRDAMERLLMRAQEVAYRFSLLVCGDQADAEDVMQDALLKTYQHVGRIEDPEAFRTWLYTTVRNACLVKRRRRAGEPAHLESIEQGTTATRGEASNVDVPDKSRLPDQVVIDRWIGKRLSQALRTLPAPLRALVVMREIEGLSTREVATIMGISEASVKTRLHRARVKLRRQLEGL